MKVEQKGEEVWVIRNKRRGLRLKKMRSLRIGSCSECYLWRVGRYCLRSFSFGICDEDTTFFRRVYENSKRWESGNSEKK